MTYFKPKNLGDVRLLLGGIDDNVPVTLTSGVQLPSTVRTVGDLRRLTAWPTKHRLDDLELEANILRDAYIAHH